MVRTGLTLAAIVAAVPAAAQMPKMTKIEAAQLYAAGGFPIVNDRPTNSCGRTAQPRITFVDINGDKRPEALFVDTNAACYKGNGRAYAVAARDARGWRSVIRGAGSIAATGTQTGGWFDMAVTDRGCTRPYRYTGERYEAAGACGAKIAAVSPAKPAPRPAGKAPPPPPKGAAAPMDENTAIYRAAGAAKIPGGWSLCAESPRQEPARIETKRDLNGDGRPEAVVMQSGSYCYGSTEQGYALVSKQADGSWKPVPGAGGQGIPEFLTTKGAGGWPDIELGGPGFCFPVWRFNGREYDFHRTKEYQKGACARR